MKASITTLGALGALFFILCHGLFAQASPEPSMRQNRGDILRYGIDSEIIELLGQLEKDKDDSFNEDVLKVFRDSRNLKLRQSILDYFGKRAWTGAEAEVALILPRWEDEEEKLIVSCIQYGTEIKSKTILEAGRGIFSEEDSALLQPMVRLAGAAGGEPESKMLLSILEDEPAESLKHAVIQALGSSGGMEAVNKLIAILEDSEAGKFERLYACESLGKLADARAVSIIVKAANDADPNLRTTSLGALGAFDSEEARNMVIEGLRDSYEPARVQAAKSAGKLAIAKAEDALLYKMHSDPSQKVKEASMRSLAEIGGSAGWKALESYLLERKNPESLRLVALRLILEKKESALYDAVRRAFDEESKEKSTLGLQRMALAISESADAALEDMALLFLHHKDYIIRAYGTDWVRRNKRASMKDELERLKDDPSELVKKRAILALEALP